MKKNVLVSSFAFQKDGKIIIGREFHWFYEGFKGDYLKRFNEDATLDSTFKPGSGPDNVVSSIKTYPNGKILIGGDFWNYNGVYFDRTYDLRLNYDGSLDTSFKSIGLDWETKQPDGKILLNGRRLNEDLSLDTTFYNGKGTNTGSYQIVLQKDGKIILFGEFKQYNDIPCNNIIRLNVNGSLDTSFYKLIPRNGIVKSQVLQPDGKIIFGGDFYINNNNNRVSIVRYNEDGSIDKTFKLEEGANGVINSMALQQDGRLLIGGTFTKFNGENLKGVARLNADGTIDTTFKIGSGLNGNIYSITIQQNRKILIGGNFTEYNSQPRNNIARINDDGSLDNSFNPVLVEGTIHSIIKQQDGKIIIGGRGGDVREKDNRSIRF